MSEKVIKLTDTAADRIKEIKTYDEIMEFSFIKDHGINLKNLNTRKNYDLILDILGYKHIKKPNDLIYLFGWKSNLKKFISEITTKTCVPSYPYVIGYFRGIPNYTNSTINEGIIDNPKFINYLDEIISIFRRTLCKVQRA